MYIEEIGRPSLPITWILEEINTKVNVLRNDQLVSPKLQELDFKDELSELALEYVDEIISTDHGRNKKVSTHKIVNTDQSTKNNTSVIDQIKNNINIVYEEMMKNGASMKGEVKDIMDEREEIAQQFWDQNGDQKWKYAYDFKSNKTNDKDQKTAMIHAILFFKEAKDVVSATNFHDMII